MKLLQFPSGCLYLHRPRLRLGWTTRTRLPSWLHALPAAARSSAISKLDLEELCPPTYLPYIKHLLNVQLQRWNITTVGSGAVLESNRIQLSIVADSLTDHSGSISGNTYSDILSVNSFIPTHFPIAKSEKIPGIGSCSTRTRPENPETCVFL